MKKEYQQNPIIEVKFKDLVFMADDNGMLQSMLETNITIEVEGRKTPKKSTFSFIFCPLCGVRYKGAFENLPF
ncbi:hypothetical protein [Psychrobacter sp. W2-37-MNA-CIBAN-0211]|uniref:hypothetical protein n=1 Tax=Psychrobacter sp. W2-37-MNA-CIBAN-0211 TaxID=3140443 RepID=UPI003328AFCC